MFAPDVEERFNKIEDNLLVMSELQRRFEARTEDRVDRLAAIQNAMAVWTDKMADRQDRMAERQEEMQVKMLELREALAALSHTVAELSHTVDRFLKARMNGG